MGENTNKLSKRIWTTDETKAFLDAYGKRRFEFESARLKKFAMRNVLEDLTALGVLTQTTTEEMLKTKLKKLLRAYKSTIDHNKRTGEFFIKAPFAEQMEEIFGSQPIIKNSHTINLCGQAIEGLPMGTNSFPRPESSISTSSPAASNKNRLTSKERYYIMKETMAAEKNEILKHYRTSKLKKKDEAKRAKEARLDRKKKLLRELFNKP